MAPYSYGLHRSKSLHLAGQSSGPRWNSATVGLSGLFSYGPYSYGTYSYGLHRWACQAYLAMARIVMAHIVMAYIGGLVKPDIVFFGERDRFLATFRRVPTANAEGQIESEGSV